MTNQVANLLDSPILVTGAERSGSSIVAKIIHLCGAFTGETTSMYENIRMREKMESYYGLMGISIRNQYPLPDLSRLPKQADFKYSFLQFLKEQGWDKQSPYMYKSYTICQTWKLWREKFPDAKWIIVRRRTGDIVYSCMHTGFMHSYSRKDIQEQIGVADEREGWVWWVRQHEKLFDEISKSEANCMVVWPERIVNGDYTQIKEMIQWLGLTWREDIPQIISPMLWKSKLTK